jgi:hypothetical protein
MRLEAAISDAMPSTYLPSNAPEVGSLRENLLFRKHAASRKGYTRDHLPAHLAQSAAVKSRNEGLQDASRYSARCPLRCQRLLPLRSVSKREDLWPERLAHSLSRLPPITSKSAPRPRCQCNFLPHTPVCYASAMEGSILPDCWYLPSRFGEALRCRVVNHSVYRMKHVTITSLVDKYAAHIDRRFDTDTALWIPRASHFVTACTQACVPTLPHLVDPVSRFTESPSPTESDSDHVHHPRPALL